MTNGQIEDLFTEDNLRTTHTIAKVYKVKTDNRVFFRRPDETIYAVIGPAHMRSLKRGRQLDNFLQQQRDSGIVIQIARA